MLEPGRGLDWNWHIEAVADHVQAVLEDWIQRQHDPAALQRIQNLLINIPPGTGKSRIVSVFAPAWMWLWWPSWRAIFLSANPRVALRDSMYCRELLTSDWYQSWFRPTWVLATDQNAKGKFGNSAGGFRQALGITARITGDRADALFVDDPHDAQEVNSQAQREEVTEKWDTAIANRVNDLRSSVRVGIMQRLHENDWSGHVLKRGGWEHLCLPMEFEPARARTTAIGWSDPRTLPGEILHPVRFTPEVLRGELLRLGSYGYAGQMQQRPSPGDGGIFKRAWWGFYVDPPYHFDAFVGSWDMTFKETADGSWVVGQVWGLVGVQRYLLDQVRFRADFAGTKTAVRTFAAKWRQVDLWLIEDKANGPAIISELRGQISGLVAVPVKGGKDERAWSVTPECEAGNVLVPSPVDGQGRPRPGVEWVNDWIEEMAGFPNAGFDDQVDAATQALERLKMMIQQRGDGAGYTVVRR